MVTALQNLFTQLEILPPRAAGRLQVFGLRWQIPSSLSYLTLDEALAAESIEVTEISEGGSVPALKVRNHGEALVFLMAGEQLIGAKQDRVLNASLLVVGRSDLSIPVSCVEQGRWRYRSPKFGSAGTASHSYLRAKMSKASQASYKHFGTPDADQGEVWNEVSRKLHALGSSSPSAALHQVYEDQKSRLQEMIENMPAPEGASGAVFTFNGRIAGMDLFDQSQTLKKLWPKLLRAYAIDAMESPPDSPPVSLEAVRAWLESAMKAESREFKSPGLGSDWRLETEELVGASLVVGESPVHTELFSARN
ncbi:MAG: hypothetical protein HY717_12800 [Planctomycetes bacterium]|nr:hypothetical protein [Planctomycetota bacterium]